MYPTSTIGSKNDEETQVSDNFKATVALEVLCGQFAKSPCVRSEVAGQAAEIRRLKRELARVTEERRSINKANAYFARESPLAQKSDFFAEAGVLLLNAFMRTRHQNLVTPIRTLLRNTLPGNGCC